jgi:general secretion pathway protein F
MEAADPAVAAQRLQAMNYIPVRIEPGPLDVAEKSRSLAWLRRERITQEEIRILTQELATLLNAGLPLDRVLEIMVALAENDKVRQMLHQVREEVRGGSSLSTAMEARQDVFSRFYLNMVRAGEAGGSLGPVLQRISEFLERSRALKEVVTSALIYPTILIAVSVISVMMLLIFVVPQFTRLFEQSGKALPLPTQIVVASGDFLRHDWWILAIAAVALYGLMRQQLNDPVKRFRWDGWMLRMPLVGDLVARIEMARFSRNLGTLLGNGVTLLKALFVVKETLSNSVLAHALEDIATQLKAGLGLGQPMMNTGLFPKLAVHMIMVGEETGQLEKMLLRVADVYDREVQTAVRRLLGMLEPTLILGLGLLVGGIIMSILVAILSINDLAM